MLCVDRPSRRGLRLSQEVFGGCVYGENCGGRCSSLQPNGKRRYKNVPNGEPDPLDYACMVHDKCLQDYSPKITQYDATWNSEPHIGCRFTKSSRHNCHCDAELVRKAEEVSGQSGTPSMSQRCFLGSACRPIDDGSLTGRPSLHTSITRILTRWRRRCMTALCKTARGMT